jgi:quinol-cytochrome oxidoreductase complex cytochrome b subunit
MNGSHKQTSISCLDDLNGKGLASGLIFTVLFFISLCFITGIALIFFYIPDVDLAFNSVIDFEFSSPLHYLVRLAHVHFADAIAFLLISYLGYSLYYRYHTTDNKWYIGMVVFFFIYVLNYSGSLLMYDQMSYWQHTLFRGLIDLLYPYFFVDESVNLNTTLIIHVLCAVVVIMLWLFTGLSFGKKLLTNSKSNLLFIIKNIFWFTAFTLMVLIGMFWMPFGLQYLENYIPADPLITPDQIIPNWTILPFYAILRAIPGKEEGLLMMILTIALLFCLPQFKGSTKKQYNLTYKLMTILFFSVYVILSFIGSQPAEGAYLDISRIALFHYLVYFVYQWCSSRVAVLKQYKNVKINTLAISLVLAYLLIIPIYHSVLFLAVYYVFSSACQFWYKRASLTPPVFNLGKFSGRIYLVLLCLAMLVSHGYWDTMLSGSYLYVSTIIFLDLAAVLIFSIVLANILFMKTKFGEKMKKKGYYHDAFYIFGSTILILYFSSLLPNYLAELSTLELSTLIERSESFYIDPQLDSPLLLLCGYFFSEQIGHYILAFHNPLFLHWGLFLLFLLPFTLPKRSLKDVNSVGFWGNLSSFLFFWVVIGMISLLIFMVGFLEDQGSYKISIYWLYAIFIREPYIIILIIVTAWNRFKRVEGVL